MEDSKPRRETHGTLSVKREYADRLRKLAEKERRTIGGLVEVLVEERERAHVEGKVS